MRKQIDDGPRPATSIVGCSDSRLVPWLLTGTGPGELLLVRKVGAFLPPPRQVGGISWCGCSHRVCCSQAAGHAHLRFRPQSPAAASARCLAKSTRWRCICGNGWNSAAQLAQAQGAELQDDRRLVIRFMRGDCAEHQICADAGQAMKRLDQRHPGRGRQRPFEIFPCVDLGD